MKKFLILLFLTLFLANPTFATCSYNNFCPEYKQTFVSKTNKWFSKYSGSTFFAQKFIQNILSKKLQKIVHSKCSVNVKGDTAALLFNGTFKSLTLHTQNVNIHGINISDLRVTTLCNKNSINLKTKPIKLKENMVLAFKAEFSDKDIQNTFKNQKYLHIINHLNLASMGISSYELLPESIKIKNNKLCYTMRITPKGKYKPMVADVSSDMMIKEGKIVYSKVDFVNLYTGFDPTQFNNSLNPEKYLSLNVYLYGNQTADIRIQNFIISGNKIVIDGVALMPKSFD